MLCNVNVVTTYCWENAETKLTSSSTWCEEETGRWCSYRYYIDPELFLRHAEPLGYCLLLCWLERERWTQQKPNTKTECPEMQKTWGGIASNTQTLLTLPDRAEQRRQRWSRQATASSTVPRRAERQLYECSSGTAGVLREHPTTNLPLSRGKSFGRLGVSRG